MSEKTKTIQTHAAVPEHGFFHGIYRVFFYIWLFMISLLSVLYLLPIYTDIPEFSVTTLMFFMMILALPVFIAAGGFGLYGIIKGFLDKQYYIVLSGLLMLLGTGLMLYIGVFFEDVLFSPRQAGAGFFFPLWV